LCEGTVLEAVDFRENHNKRHCNLFSAPPISEEKLSRSPGHLDHEHLYRKNLRPLL
jgi:hypothetical protein